MGNLVDSIRGARAGARLGTQVSASRTPSGRPGSFRQGHDAVYGPDSHVITNLTMARARGPGDGSGAAAAAAGATLVREGETMRKA